MQCCSSWLQRSSGASLQTPETACALSGRASAVIQRWHRPSSETQGGNVLRCKTKVRKLFIIKRSERSPYALLPGVVAGLNKSTHQAGSGFQGLGRTCAHASPTETENS